MDYRAWFLTWTTYGTWLPGDRRGFVSRTRHGPGPRRRQNAPGTPYERDKPALVRAAIEQCKQPPVFLKQQHCEAILHCLQQTMRRWSWRLLAVAILRTHIHVLLLVQNDPSGFQVLRVLKGSLSRELSRKFEKPTGFRWWTSSGSTRCLKKQEEVISVTRYIEQQPNPLLVWTVSFQENVSKASEAKSLLTVMQEHVRKFSPG